MTTTHQGEIHLNFNGAPIIEGVGADPGFIGKAIPAFTGLVQALCQEPDGDTPDTDTFPILLVRLNTGSCTFRIQENDQLSSHGMSRFQEVIDSFAEEEQEETEEVLNGITGESFTCLRSSSASTHQRKPPSPSTTATKQPRWKKTTSRTPSNSSVH